jgi:hypothetical protein
VTSPSEPAATAPERAARRCLSARAAVGAPSLGSRSIGRGRRLLDQDRADLA